MDELTFILILAGISVVLLVAMFTYYKHHKNINDEIQGFNNHANDIDDILLGYDEKSNFSTFSSESVIKEGDFPDSFVASRNDKINIDLDFNEHKKGNKKTANLDPADEKLLVDGVYVNSKRRTIKSGHQNRNVAPAIKPKTKPHTKKHIPLQKRVQKIKVVHDPLPKGVDDLIIFHTILAKGVPFSGPRLFRAFENAGLSYDKTGFFHYPGDEKEETFALFSIANIVEPGTFEVSKINTMQTPGISLFLRLPTSNSNYNAYEKFIRVANVISAELGGELCDETRSKLTQQAIGHKKELIKQLNFDITKAQKLADKGY